MATPHDFWIAVFQELAEKRTACSVHLRGFRDPIIGMRVIEVFLDTGGVSGSVLHHSQDANRATKIRFCVSDVVRVDHVVTVKTV